MCVSCHSLLSVVFFFFKHKTAYEMRISDWSSDVCSSDLIETVAAPASKSRGGGISGAASGRIQRLDEVQLQEEPRAPTGMPEMDRVLGGGIVPGAVILIGGDPGIGKSTLLLQMLAEVQARHSTLYVTGEESLTQVHLRAKRLGLTRLDLPVLRSEAH